MLLTPGIWQTSVLIMRIVLAWGPRLFSLNENKWPPRLPQDPWPRLPLRRFTPRTVVKPMPCPSIQNQNAKVISNGKSGSNTLTRNVLSPVYVDAPVLRDRDTDANGTLDERLFVIQDANYNVTAVISSSGTVQERYTYTPFGLVTYRDASGSGIGSSTKAWVFLHQGGQINIVGDYDFRNRVLSPTLGRWLTNDPLGFAAGDANTFRYEGNGSISRLDSSGLDWWYPGKYLHQIFGELERSEQIDAQRRGDKWEWTWGGDWNRAWEGYGIFGQNLWEGSSDGAVMTGDGATFGLVGAIGQWTRMWDLSPLYEEYGNASFKAGNVAGIALAGAVFSRFYGFGDIEIPRINLPIDEWLSDPPPDPSKFGYRVMTNEEWVTAKDGNWTNSDLIDPNSVENNQKWFWETRASADKWLEKMISYGEDQFITKVPTAEPITSYPSFDHPPEGIAHLVPIKDLGPAIIPPR